MSEMLEVKIRAGDFLFSPSLPSRGAPANLSDPLPNARQNILLSISGKLFNAFKWH